MKMGYIIIALTIFLFILAACSTQKAEKEQKQIACEKPYILIEGDCCLDANSNGICDKNEVEKKPGADLLPGPYVSERCDGGSKLKCVGYTIGLNSINIKFQSTSKDLINVKKISLPSLGCSQNFASTAELRFDEAQEFRMPCTIKHTTVDTDMVISTEIRTVQVKSTGEVYGVSEPSESETTGHLSGAVKV